MQETTIEDCMINIVATGICVAPQTGYEGQFAIAYGFLRRYGVIINIQNAWDTELSEQKTREVITRQHARHGIVSERTYDSVKFFKESLVAALEIVLRKIQSLANSPSSDDINNIIRKLGKISDKSTRERIDTLLSCDLFRSAVLGSMKQEYRTLTNNSKEMIRRVTVAHQRGQPTIDNFY